ncbi:hypothetical protein NA2_11055 [Nitratireductor pacificus pht-3B]|uniref:Uncharacterized protein n=1 Tax=Nitratireductor pacificus pht-3B TaxID=391937 RepID=K2MN77_9HYPH|nr:hypothetical protein NA2_11055 [Nitratireductor pacificus pht-3B]
MILFEASEFKTNFGLFLFRYHHGQLIHDSAFPAQIAVSGALSETSDSTFMNSIFTSSGKSYQLLFDKPQLRWQTA